MLRRGIGGLQPKEQVLVGCFIRGNIANGGRGERVKDAAQGAKGQELSMTQVSICLLHTSMWIQARNRLLAWPAAMGFGLLQMRCIATVPTLSFVAH